MKNLVQIFQTQKKEATPNDPMEATMDGDGADNTRISIVNTRDVTGERRPMIEPLANEKLFRALIESSLDIISLSNPDGTIIFVSPSIIRILGYTPEEWVGRQAIELVHPEDLVSTEPAYKEILGDPDKMLIVQYRLKHKDGSWRWIEAFVRNMLADPNVGALVSSYRDINIRKKAEQNLKRYAENNAIMTQLSQQNLTRLSLDEVYENTRLAVQKMMPCDTFVIALLDEPANKIEDVYLWDRGKRWPGETYPPGQGLTDYIISSGRTLRVNYWDASFDTLTRSSVFGTDDQETCAILAVPLIQTNGRCIGMISAQSYTYNVYDVEHQSLLERIANQMSEAIDKAQLIRDLQRSHSELSQAYEATIEGWSRAMELRDKETEGHTLRVTEMTMKLASALGIRDGELTHMRRGALLHDIGKLGVPDDILFKHDNLSEAERKVMQKHPVFALEMLSSIPYLEPALAIPYCHHEKWDGTGYPRGLKAEEIPLAARIFALADIWDALMSDRPYRPAWSKEQGIDYIREQSGKYFDPEFVEPFLKLVEDETVKSLYPEQFR